MFGMMQGLNGPTTPLSPRLNANLNPFWLTLQPEGSYARRTKGEGGHKKDLGESGQVV